MTNPNRVPSGVPEAGQWAPGTREEAPVDLASAPVRLARPWTARLEQLESEGYVAPVATRSKSSAADISRQDFWRQAHATAEYGDDTHGEYPHMSENEVRHLMTYSGSGTALRMPSRTSIRAFARNQGQSSIDVPVTVDLDGQSVSGWVRATPGPNGQWETSALGFPPAAGDRVAEGVHAVLEARRPRAALADAGNLAQRRAERRARQGNSIEMTPVTSRAFTAMGHNGGDVMAVRFHDYYRQRDDTMVTSRTYGYRVDPELYDKIATSTSPGKMWNAEVKKLADPVELRQCPQCDRQYDATRAHSCRIEPTPAPATPARDQAGRANAVRELAKRWRR